MLTLFSGFGQTFFIGLFSEPIRAEFSLSHGDFGNLYAGITFLSGLLILTLGRKIDTVPLLSFILLVFGGLALGSMLCWLAEPVWLFALGLFLVRFNGQAMLPFIARVSMARYFVLSRGKAMSLVLLGHPAGEALFPVIAVASIAAYGWHSTWAVITLVLLFGAVPLVFWFLRGHARRHDLYLQREARLEESLQQRGPEHLKRSWNLSEVFCDWRFYCLVPFSLVMPFLATAFFFFQSFIAEQKHWNLTFLAGSLAVFAGVKFMSSLAIGSMIDRSDAVRLYPGMLLPALVGMVVLSLAESPFWVPISFALLGMSDGLSPPIMNSLWPELYGPRHIGAIKSLLAGLMIFSTAAAPALFGFLIDHGMTVEVFGSVLVGLIFISTLVAMSIRPSLRSSEL